VCLYRLVGFITHANASISPEATAMKRARADTPTSVAFYGSPGAFSEDAALKYFGVDSPQSKKDLNTLPTRSLDELFSLVTKGEAEFAVVPLENSVSGLLQDVLLKLIATPRVHIVGELLHAEEHCLCTLPGARRESIRTIYSHAHLMFQSESFLLALEEQNKPDLLERCCKFDSAGACTEVDSLSKAAIASRRAGEAAGLVVLESKLADVESETRYIVVSAKPVVPTNRVGLRCSVSFMLRNQEGALFKSLSCFAFRQLNITKINTLPLGGKRELLSNGSGDEQGGGAASSFQPGPWDYAFVVDFAASQDAKVNANAMTNLKEFASHVRILGEYTSAERAENSISRSASAVGLLGMAGPF
jgi:arogenate/prephenate dehydratase